LARSWRAEAKRDSSEAFEPATPARFGAGMARTKSLVKTGLSASPGGSGDDLDAAETEPVVCGIAATKPGVRAPMPGARPSFEDAAAWGAEFVIFNVSGSGPATGLGGGEVSWAKQVYAATSSRCQPLAILEWTDLKQSDLECRLPRPAGQDPECSTFGAMLFMYLNLRLHGWCLPVSRCGKRPRCSAEASLWAA
jgi:hypothetical protein